MPNRCCVGGCSNVTSRDISLHRFPRDDAVKQEWVAQIKRTRDKWQGPGPYSLVCSVHFSEECFDPTPKLKEAFGCNQQTKRRLLPTAVPTIFGKTVTDATSDEGFMRPPASKKARTAVSKREHQRVSPDLLLLTITIFLTVLPTHLLKFR